MRILGETGEYCSWLFGGRRGEVRGGVGRHESRSVVVRGGLSGEVDIGVGAGERSWVGHRFRCVRAV